MPQVAISTSTLFVTLMSDVKQDVAERIVECFSYDTRINKIIEPEKDKEKCKKDLDNMYK